jgi:cytochrome c oxidase subunit 2
MRKLTDVAAFVFIAAIVAAIAIAFGAVAMSDYVQRATPGVGLPIDWQLNFHLPHTPFQRGVDWYHNVLLGVDLAICSLVATLLIYSVWRFRRSRNPEPSRTTHNTPLEIAWTLIPAVILVFLAVPSVRLVYAYNVPPKSQMTVKIIAHQWYWEYQYPDAGGLDITSLFVPTAKLGPGQLPLLTVDNPAVLPIDEVIKLEVTSGDVIHSFMVPSLALQKYAVPGRINEMWTKIDRAGVYRGQCSQICGLDHAFMPIVIRAVTADQFAAWAKEQKAKSAG